MNYIILGMDLIAVAGFTVAFYYAVKLYNKEHIISPTSAIRAVALFTGVIWAVLLVFTTIVGNESLLQSSASLISMIGGLFVALLLLKSY